MTLINSRGDQRVRRIKQFFKDYGKEEKTIMFFLAPSDVRDTSFMTWSYEQEGREDDQWIYLPALRRVKRISSDSKGDYFMGSDFTYDDLGDRHPSEDTHRLVRSEQEGPTRLYVVESVPRDPDYMYSRTVTWVEDERWIGRKKEFYDQDGDLLKVLTVQQSEQIDGYWVLTRLEMHNVQKNHRTRMELQDVHMDRGVSDQLFTERAMTRGPR
jgi:outer membrane lipoprotein-sorting protein